MRSIENNFEPAPEDVFVPTGMINRYQLREGEASSRGRGTEGDGKNTNLKLAEIDTVNGVSLEESAHIEQLWNQTSITF